MANQTHTSASSGFDEVRLRSLVQRFNSSISAVEIPVAAIEGGEVQLTRDFLYPVVREALAEFGNAPFIVRGDGASSQAIPATMLDQSFFPDLAVSFGSEHLWAAEVKFLRESNRNDSFTKAVGQACLYKARYRYSTMILFDCVPPSRLSISLAQDLAKNLGIGIVVRELRAGRITSALKAD